MKKLKIILIVLVIAIVGFVGCCMVFGTEDDTTTQGTEENIESSQQEADAEYNGAASRSHYVDTSKAQNVVVMLYMIGSNLESDYTAASDNLNDMLGAQLGDHARVIIDAGGAKTWNNPVMKSGQYGYYEMNDSGVDYLMDAGDASMTEPKTLTDFITFTHENYPADRYILILWDHGGGTMDGFGFDEINDVGPMTISGIQKGIKDAGVKFDIIGFDACLMSTAAIAYSLEPYADYLIASEETAAGDGWQYEKFIDALGKNPAIDSKELGKILIDEFDAYYKETEEGIQTLAMIDLGQMGNIYNLLSNYLSTAKDEIQKDNSMFNAISKARNSAREYGENEQDQVDIVDLVEKMPDIPGAQELIKAVKSAVVCHSNCVLAGSNGLAMYFPYRMMDRYDDVSTVLKQVSYTRPLDFFDYWMSIMDGSRYLTADVASPTNTPESEDQSDSDWYQQEDVDDFAYGNDYTPIALTETDDGYAVHMSKEEWDNITDIQLALLVEDEGNYLDLGADNIINVSEDGDALIDFDQTWISLAGHVIAFHPYKTYEEDGGTVFSGYTEAMLNGDTKIEIVLEWEPQTDEISAMDDYDLKGRVTGYRVVNENSNVQAKGLFPLKEGDQVDFMYDYYDEDLNYAGSFSADDPVTVTSMEDMEIGYRDISSLSVIVWVELFDIYQNCLYSEPISY